MARVFMTNLSTVAFAAGPFIVLGRFSKRLPVAEVNAIVAHEQGHIHHHHTLRRIWWILSFQWRGIGMRCREQELEADLFAAAAGHCGGLVRFVKRLGPHNSPLHPTSGDRIVNIQQWIGDKLNVL